MKSYEVKKISTILPHFYNLEKLKKTLVFSVSKTIFFLIIAVEPLRSCFFRKIRGFHRFHGWGNVQLVFKQNRPLWERAFLGALCTCNGLVCSLQSLLCSFFSFYKDKKKKPKSKKKQETKKKNNCIWPPPLGVCNLVFFVVFLFFWFLGVLLSWFVVILRDWQKKWQDLTLCHFSPLRHCKFVCGCFCLL